MSDYDRVDTPMERRNRAYLQMIECSTEAVKQFGKILSDAKNTKKNHGWEKNLDSQMLELKHLLLCTAEQSERVGLLDSQLFQPQETEPLYDVFVDKPVDGPTTG